MEPATVNSEQDTISTAGLEKDRKKRKKKKKKCTMAKLQRETQGGDQHVNIFNSGDQTSSMVKPAATRGTANPTQPQKHGLQYATKINFLLKNKTKIIVFRNKSFYCAFLETFSCTFHF